MRRDVMVDVVVMDATVKVAEHTSRKGGNGAPPLVPVVQKPVLKGAISTGCISAPSLEPFSTGWY